MVCVEVSNLLTFTLAANLGAHTSQFGSGEVSCLLRFTLGANSGSQISQFYDGGLILYWSRIRKNVTHTQRTENRQRTEKVITEATLIPWITGLSGPIHKSCSDEILLQYTLKHFLALSYYTEQ